MATIRSVPSLFDHLKGLTINKSPWENTKGFKKNYNQFMINRLVGMQDIFLELISDVNLLQLTDEQHYKLLLLYLPKKRIYFNYIKKKSAKLDAFSIHTLMDLYNISYQDVLEILQTAPLKEVKRIIYAVTNERAVLNKRKSNVKTVT